MGSIVLISQLSRCSNYKGTHEAALILICLAKEIKSWQQYCKGGDRKGQRGGIYLWSHWLPYSNFSFSL